MSSDVCDGTANGLEQRKPAAWRQLDACHAGLQTVGLVTVSSTVNNPTKHRGEPDQKPEESQNVWGSSHRVLGRGTLGMVSVPWVVSEDSCTRAPQKGLGTSRDQRTFVPFFRGSYAECCALAGRLLGLL